MRTPSISLIASLSLVAGCAAPQGTAPATGASDPGPTDGSGATEASEPTADQRPAIREDGSCEIVGAWRGPVQGGMLAGNDLTLTFSENGTAQGIVSWVTLNTLWTRRGNVVEITDVSARPALATCDEDVVGRYTLAFEEGCLGVRVIAAEDQCNHRRLSLLDLRATRVDRSSR